MSKNANRMVRPGRTHKVQQDHARSREDQQEVRRYRRTMLPPLPRHQDLDGLADTFRVQDQDDLDTILHGRW